MLAWFRSYLSGRTFRVIFSSSTSSIVYIVCSVPRTAGVSTRSAVVRCVHSRPRRYSGEARCIRTRVRWRHATVTVVAPTRRWLLDNWNNALLDVCKPTQAQQGQNRIDVGRIETQPFSASSTTRFRHHNTLRPRPCAGCNAFVRPQLDRHVSIVSASCFCWLCWLRRFPGSLQPHSSMHS